MPQETGQETGGPNARAAFPKKLGALARHVDIADVQVRAEGSASMLTFSASSEAPVERWFGKEVLSHDKGAIRMDRIGAGATPLLFNHDWNDPIGMIDSARVEDKRLVVDAHFFDTDRANEVRTMVNGGLKNISVGYRLHVVEENIDTETYTARDWEPFEFSIVSIPADPSVGVGRSEGQELEVRMLRAVSHVSVPQTPASPAAIQETRMPEAAAAAADTNAANNITALQVEKDRREVIAMICKTNNIDARVEMRWVQDGISLTQVGKEVLDVMTERQSAKPSGAANLGLSKADTQKFSMVRALRVLKYPLDQRSREEAAFEIECSNAVSKQLNRSGIGSSSSILIPTDILRRPVDAVHAQRAMGTLSGPKGDYLVNVENGGFIEILRNRSIAMSMGCRQLSGLVGNVMFPRQTGKSSVTWQGGDGASVTATDQTLGQLSMTPKTAIIVTDVSEQLLRQSDPSAESFITTDLAQTIAIDGVDNAVINGTGGAQPIGIKNTSGITSGQDAATASYAKMLAFVTTAGGVNAIRGNPGWVTNIAGAGVLAQRSRFANTDTPLWDYADGDLLNSRMIGFQAKTSEQLASGNIIFGSWDEVVIGDWGVLELSTDTGGTRFNQAQVGIRALWMVDVMLRYPQAFVVGTNLS